MIRRCAPHLMLLVSLAALLACAKAPQSEPPRPAASRGSARLETSVDVMAQPRLLREFGEAALREFDFELAYAYLATIHLLHPKSEEDAKAFPLAAAAFRGAYEKYRFTGRGSVWVTSEPLFLFIWLEDFFDGDEFPMMEMSSLLRGAPHNLTVEFFEFAKGRQALAGWQISTEADNGRTVAILGERVARDSK